MTSVSHASHQPSIKSDISEFCQTFAGVLEPFAAKLEESREEIQAKGGAEALQRPLAGISDAHHRLDSLIHKVAQQQAYLIIFGPLKSGKSTLMNAISAAYVSEVTSLPAYPCLVHVKHGDEYHFTASRYSGERLTFKDNASLQAHIQQSHETLAEKLREVEEQGGEFDPGVHYPEAIRRVDVAVPTKNLKDSLTVLVDTPGLYTRMKFGYDLMTREFRNSAACAVFVVKTDNLFLEQVFEEFNDLLDLFSRIFLVVNIDSNKRDLDPSGELKPSLESRSPNEVIQAFESLVMSAPLRRAREEGRLKIYPIDLLNSASEAMTGRSQKARQREETEAAGSGNSASERVSAKDFSFGAGNDPAAAKSAGELEEIELDDPSDEKSAGPDSPQAARVTPLSKPLEDTSAADAVPPRFSPPMTGPMPPILAPGQTADPDSDAAAESSDEGLEITPSEVEPADDRSPFSVFIDDLTEYLNSSDYLQEFMGDALHMGSTLANEVLDHCSNEATADLAVRERELNESIAETENRLQSLGKIQAVDLKSAFSSLRGDVKNHAEEVSKAASADAEQKALAQLEKWFDSEDSVADLQRQIGDLVRGCGKRVSSDCQEKVRSLFAGPMGGLRMDENLRSTGDDLQPLLAPAVDRARTSLENTEATLESGSFRIAPDDLKVRKSFLDWITFRNAATIRRRTFGEPPAMDQPVTIMIKEKRLGADGKALLATRIREALTGRFPTEAQRVSEKMLDNYTSTLAMELGERVKAGRTNYEAELAELRQQSENTHAIQEVLDELTSAAETVNSEVDDLRKKYRSYSRVKGSGAAALEEGDDEDIDSDEDQLEEIDGLAVESGDEDSDPVADPTPEIPHYGMPPLMKVRIPGAPEDDISEIPTADEDQEDSGFSEAEDLDADEQDQEQQENDPNRPVV